jgi:hypothetical protein
VAGDKPSQEEVAARVELAKARLHSLAAAIDARPSIAERMEGELHRNPWRVVAVALVAGLAIGMTRGRPLVALVPLAVPVLGKLAGRVLPAALAGGLGKQPAPPPTAGVAPTNPAPAGARAGPRWRKRA